MTVPIADYYERVRPLVEQSMDALDPVLRADTSDANGAGVSDAELAGIYVVGGGSGLPLVPRVLRERFGRRVHRSPYPSAATAMGLAIAAESKTALALREQFTRHLGVFRERDRGADVSFDRIFEKGTPMPSAGTPPLVASRVYRPAHDLGHFRFVECSAVDAAAAPPATSRRTPSFASPSRPACATAAISKITRYSASKTPVRASKSATRSTPPASSPSRSPIDAGYAERHVLEATHKPAIAARGVGRRAQRTGVRFRAPPYPRTTLAGF